MAYTIKHINDLIHTQKDLIPTENPYKVFREALTNEKACDALLGIKSSDGTHHFARYSVYDFLYDLLEFIIPIEKSLLMNGLLQPNHYFYNKVKEKFQDKTNQEVFHVLTTLIYAQTNACPHWNHSSFLTNKTINDIILTELNHNGMKSFNLLSKIFSKEVFQSTNITYNHDIHLNLNLNEYLTVSLLTQNNVNQQNSLLKLSNHLTTLDIPIDYSKVGKIVMYKHINYFALEKINSNLFNETKLYLSFNDKDYKINVLDYVTCLHFVKGLEKINDNKSATGIDGKLYNDFNNYKKHIEKTHVMDILQVILEDKISDMKKNNLKKQWQYIKLDLLVLEKLEITKKNKI